MPGGPHEPGGDGVRPGGDIRDEDDIAGVGADEVAERLACLGQQRLDPPPEEFDRLPLQFALPVLIDLEDGERAGPEAAVVEEGDILADLEEVGQGREFCR